MKRALGLSIVLLGCSDAPSPDPDAAVTGADAGLATTCTGSCQATALTAQFQTTRTLDRAYFGTTASDATLHVEAYLGGGTGCPTMSSPTPDYALILGSVPQPTSTETVTSPGNLLDYQGDLLGGDLGAQATSVTLTPVAASADAFFAFDIAVTFAGGTVTGHLYATHCASLDSP